MKQLSILGAAALLALITGCGGSDDELVNDTDDTVEPIDATSSALVCRPCTLASGAKGHIQLRKTSAVCVPRGC